MKATGEPISILFVVDGLEFGGGERTFLQLIEGLSKERFRIYVSTSRHGIFSKVLSDKGIAVNHLDLSKRVNFENIRELRRLIKTNRIDIIHSQGGKTGIFKNKYGAGNTSPPALEGVILLRFIKKPARRGQGGKLTLTDLAVPPDKLHILHQSLICIL